MSSHDLGTQIQLATNSTPTVPQQKASNNVLGKYTVGTLGSWATAKLMGWESRRIVRIEVSDINDISCFGVGKVVTLIS